MDKPLCRKRKYTRSEDEAFQILGDPTLSEPLTVLAADSLMVLVYGTPQPQGSTRAFLPKGHKRPIVTSDNPKNKSWRQKVSWEAGKEIYKRNSGSGELFLLIRKPEAVRLVVTCYLKPPQKMPKGRTKPVGRPDSDKLLRSICDALTGIAYQDDSQVVSASIRKSYGLPERAEILIERDSL